MKKFHLEVRQQQSVRFSLKIISYASLVIKLIKEPQAIFHQICKNYTVNRNNKIMRSLLTCMKIKIYLLLMPISNKFKI
jgi:hypothetical protein